MRQVITETLRLKKAGKFKLVKSPKSCQNDVKRAVKFKLAWIRNSNYTCFYVDQDEKGCWDYANKPVVQMRARPNAAESALIRGTALNCPHKKNFQHFQAMSNSVNFCLQIYNRWFLWLSAQWIFDFFKSYPAVAPLWGLRRWYSISSTVQTAPFTFSTLMKHLCKDKLCLTAFWNQKWILIAAKNEILYLRSKIHVSSNLNE